MAIGIGGSALGPLFVHTALTTDPEAMAQARRGACALGRVWQGSGRGCGSEGALRQRQGRGLRSCGPAKPAAPRALLQATGRQLTFLANVDPVDAVRALHGLDPETTLVVIVRCGQGFPRRKGGPHDLARRSQRRVLYRRVAPPSLTVPPRRPLYPLYALYHPGSKTFTTAETMLNARTVRAWLTERLGPDAVAKHMVAVRWARAGLGAPWVWWP